MSILPVNEDALPPLAELSAALGALPADAPVVVLIHGFRFSPFAADQDPHGHILAQHPVRDCWKAVSWPRHLGLHGAGGLAIGFGWEARGSIWAAHARAARAGLRLSRLILALGEVAPGRAVQVFAHSLGARVALTALPRLPAGSVGRLVLLAAAASRAEARAAMDSPAGRRAEVVNVLGRENILFDILLRAALPLRGATLGGGLDGRSNWLDLPLDRPAALVALAGLGHRIRPSRVTICHWSGYLRPGIFGLYRAILHRPAETPLATLRALTALPPPDVARPMRTLLPHWTRAGS